MNTATAEISAFTEVACDGPDIMELRRIDNAGGVSSSWHRANELHEMADTLEGDNLAGFNIYIGVNPRVRFGARGDSSIPLARVVFFDRDDTTVQATRQALAMKAMPTPAMMISSGHGVHGYYRITSHVEDLLAWRELQWDLAVMVGGDVKVKNPERVMRLPGFLNVKSEPHIPCRIIECDPSRYIDFAELRSIVPARPKPKPYVNRGGSAANVSDKLRVKWCMAYLAKIPDAFDGEYGSNPTFQAACECFRFGLSSSDAWSVMGWFNGSKCHPQWSEKELAHKLDDARAEVGSEFGCRLRDRQWVTHRPIRQYREVGAVAVGGL